MRITAVALVLVAVAPAVGWAGPINTNVALTPRAGGNILRLQYSYSEAGRSGNLLHLNASSVTGTWVHGLTEDLALFLTVPYANRQVDTFNRQRGRFEVAHDGIEDLTFLAKYRFWQNDVRPGETLRWAAIGGLNIRSGDLDFSSDSYDPIVGTVFTWQRDRGWFDADLIYQFNTGRGAFRHDSLRYDLSYAHRLLPATFDAKRPWELDGVAELNGRYGTDGSHEVFLSPGLQFITERWILETSVQLPVIQRLDGPETEYRVVLGVRFQW